MGEKRIELFSRRAIKLIDKEGKQLPFSPKNEYTFFMTRDWYKKTVSLTHRRLCTYILVGFFIGLSCGVLSSISRVPPQKISTAPSQKIAIPISPTQEISPSPTYIPKSAPKTESDIQWKTYNFTTENKEIAFSFRFPDPGDYCNGCFDGWGVPSSNVSGQWITGGYYKEQMDRKWDMTVGIYYPETSKSLWPSGAELDAVDTTMIESLKKLAVGQSTEVKNRYNTSPIRGTRLADKTIMEQPTKLYAVTEDKNAYTYAFIEYPQYTVIFTYSYDASYPIYNVANRILDSFSEKLVDAPNFGELLSNYINRKNGEHPSLVYNQYP
ncbi:hypothetical protein HGA88_06540 [Candidatus Roizmanbacteria bacterium]|nr:hypothetical protein [Candidatus Roizmanbacteria bacterium]